MQRMDNRGDLTKLYVPDADDPRRLQADHGMAKVAPVEVVFRNHRERLIEAISEHPYVLGCVAWLTDAQILAALAQRKGVSILVQKEDFLRPDSDRSGNAEVVRAAYARLPEIPSRYALPGIGSELSVCSSDQVEAVRCVGNHNAEKHPAHPRMHNKFVVLCDMEGDEEHHGWLVPRAVWTGSFNMTFTASRSWENAVLIRDGDVAEAYAREYAQILAFSEELDWESRWVAPFYRVGT